MPVDLENKETNVFDLTIKESKATPPPFFDPQTEITNQDWEIIRSRASANNSSLLVAAKLFKPEIIKELNVRSPTKVFNDLKNTLKLTRGNVYKFASLYVDCIQIYPEYFCNVDPRDFYKNSLWEDMTGKIGNLVSWGHFTDLAEILAQAKIIYPNEKLEINAEDYKEKFREQLVELEEDSEYLRLAKLAFWRNVLFPQDPLKLDQKILENIKADMEEAREIYSMGEFCEIAILLYYLTSGRLEVGKGGIVVVRDEEKGEDEISTPVPIPEVRSF